MVSYCVHVTRAGDWADSGGYPLPLDRLKSVAVGDPQLRLVPAGVLDDHDLYAMVDGIAEPLGVWQGGEIVVRDPGPWRLARAALLTVPLGAYLIGDDGDRYRAAAGELRRSTVGVDESVGDLRALLASGPHAGWPRAPWEEPPVTPARRPLWRRLLRR